MDTPEILGGCQRFDVELNKACANHEMAPVMRRGYSRLMGADEVGTLKGLTERRAILDRLIGEPHSTTEQKFTFCLLPLRQHSGLHRIFGRPAQSRMTQGGHTPRSKSRTTAVSGNVAVCYRYLGKLAAWAADCHTASVACWYRLCRTGQMPSRCLLLATLRASQLAGLTPPHAGKSCRQSFAYQSFRMW
jgi:hypothetical protein